MQTATDILRDIRAGYPESVYESDAGKMTGQWLDAILAADNPQELLYPILHGEVGRFLREETLDAEKEAQRAERDAAGSAGPAGSTGGFGNWEKNTSRNGKRQGKKPYGNDRMARRTAHLAKTVVINGVGKVEWRNVTEEMLLARIAMYDRMLKGIGESRQFAVRQLMYLRETDGATTLGEAYTLTGGTFDAPPADDLAAL